LLQATPGKFRANVRNAGQANVRLTRLWRAQKRIIVRKTNRKIKLFFQGGTQKKQLITLIELGLKKINFMGDF